METEKFSPEDSLQLVRSMIDKTRRNMGDNSIHFLLWGWMTFIACVGQFILKNSFNYEKHYMVWLLVIPTALLSIYFGNKAQKDRQVKTYIGESMKYLWMGMGISFFVLSMILTRLGWDHVVFPFFILLYGLGTFISGMFLQFRPLVIGGIIAWILAITAAYFNYDQQMLFAAAAILFSYLIPGYLLKSRSSKEAFGN